MTPDSRIAAFARMLAGGRDGALLRFGLGSAYLDRDETERAREHLAVAVELDPGYSAAWKLLGRAALAAGDRDAAIAAWQRGIEVAGRRGDQQAEKEMRVFLRRAERGADRAR